MQGFRLGSIFWFEIQIDLSYLAKGIFGGKLFLTG